MKHQPGYKVLTAAEVARVYILCGCIHDIAEKPSTPDNTRVQLELVEKKIEEIICPDGEQTTS
jgi:hypothetical protein